jgi:hypothetical protein
MRFYFIEREESDRKKQRVEIHECWNLCQPEERQRRNWYLELKNGALLSGNKEQERRAPTRVESDD